MSRLAVFSLVLLAGCLSRQTICTERRVFEDRGVVEERRYYTDSEGKKVYHGAQVIRYADGSLKGTMDVRHGKLHGWSREYSRNGTLLFETQCKGGLCDGSARWFSEHGELIASGIWDMDRRKSGTFGVEPAVYEIRDYCLVRALDLSGRPFTGTVEYHQDRTAYRIEFRDGQPVGATDPENHRYAVTPEGTIGTRVRR